MSAAEIIEQIKALPAAEQARVAEFIHGFAATNGEASQVRYVDPEDARVIADKVFEENAELFRKLAQ